MTFRKYLEHFRIPKDLNNIILQIINGISELHQLGYIHRDLKPENIMMNLKTKEVKIIDFDRVCLDTTMTMPLPRGTPGYFPENAEWRNGSKKWDVWALAAIILEADMQKDEYKKLNKEELCIKAAEEHIKTRKASRTLKQIMKETILKANHDI